MHIKLLYRKVLYVFLSLMIVISSTQSAFAASAWSITSVASAGARAVVSASKSGYKSAVNIAPTATRLGVGLLRVGNTASLLYAAAQLGSDGIDFVIDPANNRIKYKVVKQDASAGAGYLWTNAFNFVGTAAAAAADSCAKFGRGALVSYAYTNPPDTTKIGVVCTNGSGSAMSRNVAIADEYKYISIPAAAAQVLKNAAAGNAQAQSAVRAVATEMVIGGQFDQDLLQGAVPTNDTKPLVPSVPISGNGNAGYGGVGVGDAGDDGMSGASPGEQADAAKDAAEAAKNAADAAKDAAKAAAEQAAKDAADAQDLINSAADQAAIDAANAKAAAAEKAAADAKAVADAAVAAANDRAKAAEKAAEAATEAAKKAAADAAKALADAKAAGDAAATAAAEKAKAEADAAVAAAKEKQAAAEKAAEKAKAEAAKPFELPAFCSWATPVCDYMTWVKQEYSGMKEWLTVEAVESVDDNVSITETIEDGWQDKVNAGYVSFQAQCPENVLIPVSLMGASQSLNISYAPFCHFASLIKPAVILGAWISGLLIISGGRGRE